MDYLKLIDSSQTLKNFVIKSKNLSSCMLIVSEDDLMLEPMATYFAMAVCCKNTSPCFECPSCKKILNKNAIEVLSYPKFKKDITVEDIKEIVRTIYERPLDFDKKIYILNRIDLSNVASQNKLLKTLEELPDYAMVIMTATSTEQVLPTVLSRSNVFTVPKLKKQEALSLLATFEGDLPSDVCYDLSGNNIFLAGAMKNDENIIKIYEKSISLLHNIKRENFADYISYIEKGKANEYLKIINAIVGRLIDIKAGLYDENFFELSEKFSLQGLVDITKQINDLSFKLKFNTNEQSVIDVILLTIMEKKIDERISRS